jgi:protein-disulfide isomerase
LVSKEIVDFVKAERTSAIKFGLQGTPSFFINGQQIQNPTSIDAFKTIIKEAISKNS